MSSELSIAASEGLSQALAVADPSNGINPWPVFTMFLALLICLFAAVLLHKYHVHAVPESAVFILIGVIVGGINRAITPVPIAAFDASFFLTVLLPIIIFEAGFSVDKRSFFRNFGTINSLAVVGTIISTFVVGYGLHLFNLTGIIYTGATPLDPLLFGSILSAIDPVATLALFSSLQVDRTLYALVFGESVMNDAVAVAMYQTLLEFRGVESFGALEVFEALGLFLAKFLGSSILGIVFGGFVSYLLKHARVQQSYVALGIFICSGYVAYTICEGARLSGIMGVFFTGFALKHYAYYNISLPARTSVSDFLKAGAFLAESSIYIFLGMAFFVDPDLQEWNAAFISLALFLCLLGRALNVFPLTNVANYFRKTPVSWKFQLFMWHSGLRGAIAFALVSTLPLEDPEDEEEVNKRELYITSTLAIVIITTVVIGMSAPPMLKALNIKTGDRSTPEEEAHERQQRLAMANKTTSMTLWNRLDKKYLLPLLSNKMEELTAEQRAQYSREIGQVVSVSPSGYGSLKRAGPTLLTPANAAASASGYFASPHQDEPDAEDGDPSLPVAEDGDQSGLLSVSSVSNGS